MKHITLLNPQETDLVETYDQLKEAVLQATQAWIHATKNHSENTEEPKKAKEQASLEEGNFTQEHPELETLLKISGTS